MQARIVRGTPSKTLQGQSLWQLETRPSPKSDWSRMYGSGHNSTLEHDLVQTARINGWTIIHEEQTSPCPEITA